MEEQKTKVTITGNNSNPYKPFIYALLVASGILAGMSISRISFDKQNLLQSNESKIDEIMTFVKYKYVDTINQTQLEEKAIQEMLSSLDPHSVYIPAEEIKSVNEDLDGNFEGIGIEFYIVKDTITVVSVIPNGPAEASGLMAGDRIIKINDTIVAGTKIKNQDVMHKLKGQGGTKVKVGIARGTKSELQNFTITRDKIPLYSIDASFLIDEKTGYIKINRFSSTTHKEFRQHLRELTDKNIKNLVIDLRQNPGGYLQAATEIAD
ncbi:MAG TPA: S41 family peptidase, partial [Chitinophagales bacterium]